MIWELSERRVRVLCSEGRIEGVVKVGRSWNIPEDATKPLDYRNKSSLQFTGIIANDFSKVTKLQEKLASLRPFSHNQLKMIKEDLTDRGKHINVERN